MGSGERSVRIPTMLRESSFRGNGMTKFLQDFSDSSPGQSSPRQYAHPESPNRGRSDDLLGEPLGIREVARLVGCSVWTVRHRLLQRGLPYVRFSGRGRLTFYRNQVTQWVLEIQNEGR